MWSQNKLQSRVGWVVLLFYSKTQIQNFLYQFLATLKLQNMHVSPTGDMTLQDTIQFNHILCFTNINIQSHTLFNQGLKYEKKRESK